MRFNGFFNTVSTVDLADEQHKVLSEGYGRGGPGVCLDDGQTEAYLKDMSMTGLASAWAMARRMKDTNEGYSIFVRYIRSRLNRVCAHNAEIAE